MELLPHLLHGNKEAVVQRWRKSDVKDISGPCWVWTAGLEHLEGKWLPCLTYSSQSEWYWGEWRDEGRQGGRGLIWQQSYFFSTIWLKCEVKLSRQQTFSKHHKNRRFAPLDIILKLHRCPENEESKETLRQKHWNHSATEIKQNAPSSHFSFLFIFFPLRLFALGTTSSQIQGMPDGFSTVLPWWGVC